MLKNIFLLSAVALCTFSASVKANSPEKEPRTGSVVPTTKRLPSDENYSPARKDVSPRPQLTRSPQRNPLSVIQHAASENSNTLQQPTKRKLIEFQPPEELTSQKKSALPTVKNLIVTVSQQENPQEGFYCISKEKKVYCLAGSTPPQKGKEFKDIRMVDIYRTLKAIETEIEQPLTPISLSGDDSEEEIEFHYSDDLEKSEYPIVLIRTDTFAQY